ncbi:MAG: hypothetical protein JNM78_05715 [Cyclobacteriaceae bacterium]|nr:hypothetical protein [Cyclobacteriaceae bacterium]
MKNIITLTALFLIVLSCNDIDDFNLSEEELRLQSESIALDNNLIITNAEEIMGITSNILEGANIRAHGRIFNKNGMGDKPCDPSIDHFYITDLTHYDTILYIGRLTLDYGNGNTCDMNANRKGKVIDDFLYIFNTKNELYSSRETITFENYQKDSNLIEGTFMITSNSQQSVTLTPLNVRVTYPDGTFLTMIGELNFYTVSDQSAMKFSGSMEGIARSRKRFTSTITTPVEYSYNCSDLQVSVPVKGTVQLQINKYLTTVEYGDGTCDRTYTTMSNGNRNTYSF